MKIRSEEQLLDRLDTEASWRMKELTMLTFSLREGRESNESMFIRSSIALSYAHWEGFIKSSSEYFLIYLSFLKIRGDQISKELRYTYLFDEFRKIGSTKKVSDFKSFYEEAENVFKGAYVDLDHKRLIATKSNLNPDVFMEIADRLGVGLAVYETKFPLIDNLVKHRNSIAHGENPIITSELAEGYIKAIRELIEMYKTDLMNIIVTKNYLENGSVSQG